MASDFDPNAITKAMGAQHDPYEWAQQYASEAAKAQQLREEMKLRLMLQDKQEKMHRDEGAATRASHMTIAQYQQEQANLRTKMRSDDYKEKLNRAEKDIDWPADSMTETEHQNAPILDPKRDLSKYTLVTRAGISKWVPIGTVPTRPGRTSAMPATPYPNPAPNPWEVQIAPQADD